ncbi:MAG: AzlC family ABC transporter permease [Lachnospiraceae bacterium]|nr:AzlC family ABC transporter permease [Lachnospiraceae bacterium]
MEKIKQYRQGARDGIPIALGYFAVSFAFGMMAVTGGLSALEASLISLVNVTSAGQFAGLQIIFAGGTYLEMALTQFVINLRYALMSFSLSQKLDRSESFACRYLAAFGVTDEIFGITASKKDTPSVFYMYGAMSVAIPGWVLGTFFGGVSGAILPHAVLSALGLAIYGMFLAIIIPPAKHERDVAAVVAAAFFLSALLYYVPALSFISSGFAIIIVTVAISAGAAALCGDSGK